MTISSTENENMAAEEPFSFIGDPKTVIQELGQDGMLRVMRQMLRIRNFETRAEAAYLQGKIGGFFHAYIGQEAVQTAILEIFGPEHWYTASYRCHALALLLGATPNELMAELYGRATGNAMGRGGSMHFFTERLLGGHGIVGGQIPIATGAAFSAKYKGNDKEFSLCFLGDGAVAQGSFHESLNLASLWDLPCLYVIENNQWGMGTSVEKAISVKRIAEEKAPGYGMKGYTIDGMDFDNCYAGFQAVYREMQETRRPILVEVLTQRFKGHSVSDPGLYRSKDELSRAKEGGPIVRMKKLLLEAGILDEEGFKAMDKEAREEMVAAVKFAEESPWPDVSTLEEDVFAP